MFWVDLSKQQAIDLGFSNGDEDKPRKGPIGDDPEERMRLARERRANRPKAVYQWYVMANSLESDAPDGLGRIGVITRCGARSWDLGRGYRAGFGSYGGVKFSDVKRGPIDTCVIEWIESEPWMSEEESEAMRIKICEAFEKYAKQKKIKAAEYNVGLVQAAPILRMAIEGAIPHVEVSTARMRQYLLADEKLRATLLLQDLELPDATSDEK